MKIQPPTLGPIVGYTSSNHVRIWLRGREEITAAGEYSRAFGVVQIRPRGGPSWSTTITKLPPYFDMTGVGVFTGLAPEADYEYRAGWFYAELEFEDVQKLTDLEWGNNFPVGVFRTGAAATDRARSYVVGSCRYLLRLFGGQIGDERGDKVFASINDQIDAGLRTDGLVMAGDQIYADDINALFPDKTVDEFLSRYRMVFGQPHLRKLMGRVPTYMVLDDHEIEDNWPSKASKKDRLKLYPHAIHTYQIYQCSHSPVFALKDGRLDGTPEHYWYEFQDGCTDWFVMDSRTERDLANRRMISPAQLEGLKAWLTERPGLVKMIVTSVPFIPDLAGENDDKWGGFPEQRLEILEHIRINQVRKVVFVSGDVHCAFSAELTSPADPSFKVFQVISSAFFWPYPHINSGPFAAKGSLIGAQDNYVVTDSTDPHWDNNFARLNIRPDSLDIEFYTRKGVLLSARTRTF